MDAATLTDRQLAGQRLIVGFQGTELNTDLRFLVDTLKIGGVILFADNLIEPEQIRNLCRSLQAYAVSRENPPLFIAVDQEGGTVARLKEPFTQFPGNPHMKSRKDAVRFAKITAKELADVGINMNLAPVLDISPLNIESIMTDRSFGHIPEWVSKMGGAVIKHLQQRRIAAVAKHFPGIGRTQLDSHAEMPTLDIDLSEMESYDLRPFNKAINQKVAGMMLSHILYEKIDPRWPASLSPRIADRLLRDKMAFQGVVMTDDLDMGAIQKHFDIKTIINQILSAGIDIALICHKGPNIERAFEEILASLSANQKMRSKGLVSVDRILRSKAKFLKA
ncbi:MAG: beta-N-acetylhexosaminidase [Deltaproteobacteria bacterium]|jgi:beta-N-acetylhexosaminidase|nr:beta-N-acetylhexosaminidase [Deltaproteobacteria bacterium]